MNEASVSRGLVKALNDLPGAVVLRFSGAFVSGIPDIAVVWNGKTTWLEVKLIKKHGIIDRGIQQLMLRKLALQGSAFYVIYVENYQGRKWTFIVSPEHLNNWSEQWVDSAHGFDHSLVANFIRRLHEGGRHDPVGT